MHHFTGVADAKLVCGGATPLGRRGPWAVRVVRRLGRSWGAWARPTWPSHCAIAAEAIAWPAPRWGAFWCIAVHKYIELACPHFAWPPPLSHRAWGPAR